MKKLIWFHCLLTILLSLLFFSCSNLENSKTTSIKISVPVKNILESSNQRFVRSENPTESGTENNPAYELKITLTVGGQDITQTAQGTIEELSGKVFTFSNLETGATAVASCVIKKEGKDIWTGKSESTVISEGINNITIKMNYEKEPEQEEPGQEDPEPTTGTIEITLPILTTTQTRAAIVANIENTSYYKITLEGPSQQTLKNTTGDIVTIKDLSPGTYTVSVESYNVDDVRFTTKTFTVELKAGDTHSENLVEYFNGESNIFANTNFTWWNFDSTANGNQYLYKISSAKPSSAADLTVSTSSFQAYSANTIEDNEGVTYYLSWYGNGYNLNRYNGTSSLSIMEFIGSSIPYICYDEKNDYIYLYVSENANTLTRIDGNAARSITNSNDNLQVKSYSIDFTKFGFDRSATLKCFAIRGDDAYFVFEKEEVDGTAAVVYYTIYKVKFGDFKDGETAMGTANISSCGAVVTFLPSRYSTATDVSDVRGSITDITIASDGTAYALICDHSDFSSANPECLKATLETPIYSRGAIAKITSSGSITYLGFYDTPRTLTVSDDTATAIDYNEWTNYYSSIKELYAPDKAESSQKLYGPQKIIAKKPDELYIVDCGVNFVLAGYNPNNSAHNDQENLGYHSGNAFFHGRIMKVDLKSFALSQVADDIKVNVDSTGSVYAKTDIFGCVNASLQFTGRFGFSGFSPICTPATLEDEE